MICHFVSIGMVFSGFQLEVRHTWLDPNQGINCTLGADGTCTLEDCNCSYIKLVLFSSLCLVTLFLFGEHVRLKNRLK